MKIYNIFFSPTGGTGEYTSLICDTLSQMTGKAVEIKDMTLPEMRRERIALEPDDIAVIGAPCYAGALPDIEGLFENIEGNGADAVAVISYGNRAYDSSLAELRDLLSNQGFNVKAAGSFVAIHSFTDKCGAGRPDSNDLPLINNLCEAVVRTSDGILHIDGEDNILPRRRTMVFPEAMENCTKCMMCVKGCPSGALTPENIAKPSEVLCVTCYKCVKNCPESARKGDYERIAGIVAFLEEKCAERAPASVFTYNGRIVK